MRSLSEPWPVPLLPRGHRVSPWGLGCLRIHADILARSFDGTVDADEIPSLSTFDGCLKVMKSVKRSPSFRAEACWIISDGSGPVAAIQGLQRDDGFGWIHNLGVIPEARQRGLAKVLISQVLTAFRYLGSSHVALESNADNAAANGLYASFGFTSSPKPL